MVPVALPVGHRAELVRHLVVVGFCLHALEQLHLRVEFFLAVRKDDVRVISVLVHVVRTVETGIEPCINAHVDTAFGLAGMCLKDHFLYALECYAEHLNRFVVSIRLHNSFVC